MKYATILVLGLLAAAGCDLFNNALEVQSPSVIPASGLETPANAQLLVNGAIADFECAAGAYAELGGEITDELIDATQTADRFPYERRNMTSSDARYGVNSCIGLGVYTPLQTARFSALNVISLLQGWTDAQVPGRDTLIPTLQAYQGYSLVLLGEGFCTMVVSTQYIEPSFARFLNSPRQIRPLAIVTHRFRMNSFAWYPELRIRCSCPTVQSSQRLGTTARPAC